ncbi:hypothetical protein CPS_2403 [Colwellia psychrerythraea 34H]|uniref:Uncharacterized protein n=1 Tax=Colwellia psychrerythraea (strain 34H / ATCC BAA-681) TaxID=167879 RepID=Q481Z8_COLP3|nr:hypothetical protein CPS_2403 [Colwellia psychrerythraea 34H]
MFRSCAYFIRILCANYLDDFLIAFDVLGNPKNRDNSALASIVADSDIVLVQELVASPS